MRFVVVGAGALGSIYAGYLARAGHRVRLIARGERAQALRKHGLTVVGSEEFTVPVDIVTRPQDLIGETVDATIVAVKTYDTAAALEPLRGLVTKCAISVQNGVRKNAELAEHFGSDAVLGAVSMLGGEVLPATGDEPGAVDYKMPAATIVGEPDGNVSDRAAKLGEALSGAGLPANAVDDIHSVEWSKFVGWSGVSALAVLTRLPTYRFLIDPDTATLAARVMRETAAVARAQDIALQGTGMTHPSILDGDEASAVAALVANGENMRERAAGFRQSILQDADRGRRLEVDETLGHALELAAHAGLETPTLDYCCRVLRVVSRAATD